MESSVALVGFYGRCNFGDDLMAVIFSKHLESLGVPYSGHRLDPEDVSVYGLRSSSTLDALLEGRNTLVWGGGGLLVSWPNLAFKVLFPGVSTDFGAVVSAARERKMRMLAISVGGSGRAPASLTPAYKEEFLRGASHVTVRNPQDLEILHSRGVAGEYFPDIVWLTPEYFPVARRPNSRFTIGVDLYWNGLVRQRCASVVWRLRRLIRRRSDCDFVLLDTTRRQSRGPIRPARIMRGPNTRELGFRSLQSDIRELASLDLIVSSRLHAGVVCLSYGVPLISLCGEPKSTLFMANSALSHWSFGPGDIAAFEQMVDDRSRLAELVSGFRVADLESYRSAGRGHLDSLTRLL